MTPLLAGKDAVAGAARAGEYARHRPDQTLLYQLVEQYYPAFVAHLAARKRTLPVHVQHEFAARTAMPSDSWPSAVSGAAFTPGILPCALRARLRRFQIAPGDLVKIDILTCEHCGGAVKVIASIADPVVFK